MIGNMMIRSHRVDMVRYGLWNVGNICSSNMNNASPRKFYWLKDKCKQNLVKELEMKISFGIFM
jgi:hypothetical protein